LACIAVVLPLLTTGVFLMVAEHPYPKVLIVVLVSVLFSAFTACTIYAWRKFSNNSLQWRWMNWFTSLHLGWQDFRRVFLHTCTIIYLLAFFSKLKQFSFHLFRGGLPTLYCCVAHLELLFFFSQLRLHIFSCQSCAFGSYTKVVSVFIDKLLAPKLKNKLIVYFLVFSLLLLQQLLAEMSDTKVPASNHLTTIPFEE